LFLGLDECGHCGHQVIDKKTWQIVPFFSNMFSRKNKISSGFLDPLIVIIIEYFMDTNQAIDIFRLRISRSKRNQDGRF
jgi:hypothetical protein